MNRSSSQKIVNVGLIGCGGRMKGVMQKILEQDLEHRIRLTSVFDPDPESQKAARDTFGDDFHFCTSEEELTSNPELDWVMIGSWNCHHARQSILALNAGKNVFCEKPLATTLEDCLAIRDAVRKSGRAFAFGLVLRYSPLYQRIEELVRSGTIGELISFEFNETLRFNHGGYIFGNWRRERENAGTHLLEKCCHDIDLANWIVGALPIRAASFGGRDFFIPKHASMMERIGPNEKGQPAYCSWADPNRRNPFDGEGDICDNQVAILEYSNGVRGTFHTNCNAGLPERRFYICGTEGSLRADLFTGDIEIGRIEWESKKEVIHTDVECGHGGGDEVMAKSLVETLLHGTDPLASVENGLESAIAVFGMDQAADTGCTVDLRPMWKQAEINVDRKA